VTGNALQKEVTEEYRMKSAVQFSSGLEASMPQGKAMVWTGRVITGVVVLFCAFDGIMKVIQEPHVMAASAELGYPQGSMVMIDSLLLVCTVIYAIPRSASLGAILLTGYLGGAVASNVRISHTVLECIFPVIFAVLVWAGLLLRDVGLRDTILFRRHSDALASFRTASFGQRI
jgi:DoxX-like family